MLINFIKKTKFAMMKNMGNITEKNYKKLAIQISSNKLNFCVFDLLNHSIDFIKVIDFEQFDKNLSTEFMLKQEFNNQPELSKKYDEIIVIHSNNLATFVPLPLFDEDYLGSYLQYNTKVFETDFFAFDSLQNYGFNNVYIPYVNMNNFFIDHFGVFDYKHSNTILVSTLLDQSKNVDQKKMFVHLNDNQFQLVVIQNQKLLFFNTFDYQSSEDFIYYILFTAEQLQLNPEYFLCEIIADIDETHPLFKIAYTFIRNVCIYNNPEIQKNNNFSRAENLKQFILFQS